MSPTAESSAALSRAITQNPLSAKISCLACRSAKRKCHTSDVRSRCTRCINHDIRCEYAKHQRGRKKKSQLTESSLTPTHPAIPLNRTANGPAFDESIDTHVESRSDTLPHPSDSASIDRTDVQSKDDLNIHFSHVIPQEGDSAGSPVGGITQYPVPFPQDDPLLLHHLRSGCPDPVKAGLMSDADADGMFDFYFQHLNAILAILDPNLHSANYCRQKSTLLYSSVLTVTTKVVRPKIYARCMMLTNKLVGQAVEFGLCSVHIVQALNLLHHWKKSDDHTSWRRMGYAIRMAQELRLDIKSSRPLPSEDLIAREMLNKERAWLNLIIADYHLAIHHSLPRMIHTQDVDDPADWVADHPRFAIPGESSLGPLITFSRMCRFYADNLDTKNRESETRTLHWLEVEWARWRNRWLANNERFQFTQSQLATFRLCDAYFCFHIAEYRLLATARHNHTKDHIDLNRPSALSSAFSKSVEAALGIAIVIQKDLAPYGFLPYCFYLTWVAMAVTAIWLVKNIAPMSQEDRVRVIGLLTEVQFSIEEASRSSDDMAAYTNRLLKHLLNGVSPEWQLASFLSNSEVPQDSQQISETSVASMVAAPEWTAPTAAMWEPFSAQDIIQNQLWSQHTNAEPSLHPLNLLETGRNGPSQQAQQDEAMPGSQADIPAVPNEVGGFLFPTDDDDFWRSLFPLIDTGTNSSLPG